MKTDHFRGWMLQQDNDVRGKYDSSNVTDAIDVLEMYSSYIAPETTEAAPSRPAQDDRLARAVAPTTGRTTAPRQKRLTSDEAFEAGYNNAR